MSAGELMTSASGRPARAGPALVRRVCRPARPDAGNAANSSHWHTAVGRPAAARPGMLASRTPALGLRRRHGGAAATGAPLGSVTMHMDAIFGAIGRLSVRFRWIVLLVWIVGAVAAVTQLPALSSVTQNNNSKFLPASAPSEHAAELAAPFGTANLIPIPVVAARSGSPLTSADVAAMTALQQKLRTVPTISRVLDAGRSADGQAEQLVVLAEQGSGQNQQTDQVNALRAKIAQTSLPAGLHAHLAGDVAIQVDQQKASGNQGNEVQDLSIVFIIGLLVLIFRSLTLALTTIAPAVFSVIISGPLVAEAAHHGLQVSPLAQFLLIVLVLGAGTDYGLFLVFRVREELRAERHGAAGENYPGSRGLGGSLLGDLLHPRPPARRAIVRSVTKVGES